MCVCVYVCVYACVHVCVQFLREQTEIGTCGALVPFVSLLDKNIFCEVLSGANCAAPPTLDSGSTDKTCKHLRVSATSILAATHYNTL